MRRATLRALVCLLSLWVLAPQARAANDAEHARKKQAAEYFARGSALFEKGEYARAVEQFRKAYEMIPHQGVLGNIGLCYDKIGDWPQAVQFYRRYFADPVASQVNDPLRDRLKELELRLGEVLVRTAQETCQLRVDGVDVGSSPQRVVVWPGVHQVEAQCSSRKPRNKSVMVNARQLLAVDFPPADARPAGGEIKDGPIQGVSDRPARRRLGASFWTFAGLTAATAVTTSVFGVLTMKEKQRYEDSGNPDTAARDRGERYKLVTNISLGVTAGLGVTAAVIAMLDLRRRPAAPQTAASLTIHRFADVGLLLDIPW